MHAHGERKHSKFSASGAERWFKCPGSVHLSEGIPSKDSVWSKEGTKAHEILESCFIAVREHKIAPHAFHTQESVPVEMLHHAKMAASFILGVYEQHEGSDLMIETRVRLPFLHPDMFGTFDGAVIDYFGTLHVFDYKYGKGHAVSPVKNLQMIVYGLGLAHLFHFNFKRVRLWIIQPRIQGYSGPLYWEITISDLKHYISLFKRAIARVENEPNHYQEGPYCFFCAAKSICPLKKEAHLLKGEALFKKRAERLQLP